MRGDGRGKKTGGHSGDHDQKHGQLQRNENGQAGAEANDAFKGITKKSLEYIGRVESRF